MRVFPDFEGPMAKWPRLEAMPYAKETLSTLQPNWMIALATNAIDSNESEIRQALARVDLNGFVDKVYCYQRIGHKKPSRAFFEFILIDLRLELSKLIMVGDNYAADVLGANNLGMQAVWYNHRTRESRSGDLHQTIHDLRDLHKILNDWNLETGG
jgi:FMN phosphatase YigB (HAD superfamily)